jgi:hypothetical protein
MDFVFGYNREANFQGWITSFLFPPRFQPFFMRVLGAKKGLTLWKTGL